MGYTYISRFYTWDTYTWGIPRGYVGLPNKVPSVSGALYLEVFLSFINNISWALNSLSAQALLLPDRSFNL